MERTDYKHGNIIQYFLDAGNVIIDQANYGTGVNKKICFFGWQSHDGRNKFTVATFRVIKLN